MNRREAIAAAAVCLVPVKTEPCVVIPPGPVQFGSGCSREVVVTAEELRAYIARSVANVEVAQKTEGRFDVTLGFCAPATFVEIKPPEDAR